MSNTLSPSFEYDFINHSSKFADYVCFILPQLFESDGKGVPRKRVKGLNLIHSEKLEDQESAINIANDELKKHPNFDKILKFFNRHKEIIEMFNRFPHRNKILNRKSTEKEIAFLKTPFSSF